MVYCNASRRSRMETHATNVSLDRARQTRPTRQRMPTLCLKESAWASELRAAVGHLCLRELPGSSVSRVPSSLMTPALSKCHPAAAPQAAASRALGQSFHGLLGERPPGHNPGAGPSFLTSERECTWSPHLLAHSEPQMSQTR